MKRIRYILSALLLLGAMGVMAAQGSDKGNVFDGVVKLDKTVHDFGDISVSDGPVSTEFKVTNVGEKALVIYNVVSSCGCTAAEWTRSPLKKGESGTIKATFKNEDGAYPFDKTLTVYFSGVKRPVVLRLRGDVHGKDEKLEDTYPWHFGSLGFKKIDIKGGNLTQEQQKSGEVPVANLSSKPLKVSFSDVTPGLELNVTPNPLPAKGTGKVQWTITADRTRWGKNYYYATPVAGGRISPAAFSAKASPKAAGSEALVADANPELGQGKQRIGIYTFTKENFSKWTDEQIKMGSNPIADESTVSFGNVKSGTQVEASFSIANKGKSDLKIYKVDSESLALTAKPFPNLAPGREDELELSLDTTKLPEGECLILVTLTTNSPLRPLVNFYLTGWIS